MIVVWPASINITLIAINHVNCPEVIQTPRTSLGLHRIKTQKCKPSSAMLVPLHPDDTICPFKKAM